MSAAIARSQLRRVRTSQRNSLSDDILGLIVRRRLEIGARTSEEKILARLQESGKAVTSRTPLREALALLEAAGFVLQRPQVGCWILPVELDEAIEISALRPAVERQVVKRLAESGLGDDKGLREMADKTNAGEVDALLVADTEFHEALAVHAAFLTGASSIRVWGNRLRVLRTQSEVQFNHGSSIAKDHHSLLDALAHKNTDMAVAQIVGHINRLHHPFLEAARKQSPLLSVKDISQASIRELVTT